MSLEEYRIKKNLWTVFVVVNELNLKPHDAIAKYNRIVKLMGLPI